MSYLCIRSWKGRFRRLDMNVGAQAEWPIAVEPGRVIWVDRGLNGLAGGTGRRDGARVLCNRNSPTHYRVPSHNCNCHSHPPH